MHRLNFLTFTCIDIVFLKFEHMTGFNLIIKVEGREKDFADQVVVLQNYFSSKRETTVEKFHSCY